MHLAISLATILSFRRDIALYLLRHALRQHLHMHAVAGGLQLMPVDVLIPSARMMTGMGGISLMRLI